jgi:hypothetical protein
MFSRGIFVLVTSAVLAASPATATPDPARRYPLPTYDENRQFLSDPLTRAAQCGVSDQTRAALSAASTRASRKGTRRKRTPVAS